MEEVKFIQVGGGTFAPEGGCYPIEVNPPDRISEELSDRFSGNIAGFIHGEIADKIFEGIDKKLRGKDLEIVHLKNLLQDAKEKEQKRNRLQ